MTHFYFYYDFIEEYMQQHSPRLPKALPQKGMGREAPASGD